MMDRYQQLQDLLDGVKDDFDKFYDKDNKAAGTRVRKAMQELKNLAQEIRVEVQGKKNA
jgi:hypothetical protein